MPSLMAPLALLVYSKYLASGGFSKTKAIYFAAGAAVSPREAFGTVLLWAA